MSGPPLNEPRPFPDIYPTLISIKLTEELLLVFLGANEEKEKKTHMGPTFLPLFFSLFHPSICSQIRAPYGNVWMRRVKRAFNLPPKKHKAPAPASLTPLGS